MEYGEAMAEELIRNVIRDTRKNVKYVIFSHRKLDRKEMLREIREYNMISYHIRTKSDSTIEITAKFA